MSKATRVILKLDVEWKKFPWVKTGKWMDLENGLAVFITNSALSNFFKASVAHAHALKAGSSEAQGHLRDCKGSKLRVQGKKERI